MPARVGDHVQYLTPPETVRALPLYCLDAGTVTVPPGHHYPAVPEQHPREYRQVAESGRRLREYQLVFVAQGRGTFSGPDGEPVAVEEGTAFLLRPDEWHRYAPAEDTGWRESWVGFAGPAAAPLWELLNLGRTRSVVLNPVVQSDIVDLFHRLLATALHPGSAEQVVLAGLIQELMGRVARALASPEDDLLSDERFERARAEMVRRLRDHVDSGSLERTVGCSRSTLYRIFRRRSGMSPYRYYLALKVNAAKWELVHTNRSIKTIAGNYGFSDQYHFSRVFNAIAGQRPSTWRSVHTTNYERTAL